MKWVKQNLIIIVSLSIFLVLLATVCWFAHDVTRKLSGVEEELAAKRATFEGMLNSRPYPSKENADLLRKDRERLVKQYMVLRDAVGKSEVGVPDKLDPILFQQLLYQKWDGWKRSAADAGIKLPEKFAFGFSRYFEVAPCAGDTKGGDCARRLRLLTKELLVIDKVVCILASNRVENILAVRRAEVEQNPGLDTLGAVAEREQSSVYETLPFQFQFTCSTVNLREVLNGLSRSEYLFIIRSLTVSTEYVQQERPAANPAVNPLFALSSAQSSTTMTTSTRRRLLVTVDLALAEFPQSQKSN